MCISARDLKNALKLTLVITEVVRLRCYCWRRCHVDEDTLHSSVPRRWILLPVLCWLGLTRNYNDWLEVSRYKIWVVKIRYRSMKRYCQIFCLMIGVSMPFCILEISGVRQHVVLLWHHIRNMHVCLTLCPHIAITSGMCCENIHNDTSRDGPGIPYLTPCPSVHFRAKFLNKKSVCPSYGTHGFLIFLKFWLGIRASSKKWLRSPFVYILF